MSLKEDVEAMCEEVKKTGNPKFVQLPQAPFGWSADEVLERTYQLAHLIKINGCQLSREEEEGIFKISLEDKN